MTSLSDYVAKLIEEQRVRIASMRAMIDTGGDHAALRELARTIHSSDELIHSVAAIAGRFLAVKSMTRQSTVHVDDRATGTNDASS